MDRSFSIGMGVAVGVHEVLVVIVLHPVVLITMVMVAIVVMVTVLGTVHLLTMRALNKTTLSSLINVNHIHPITLASPHQHPPYPMTPPLCCLTLPLSLPIDLSRLLTLAVGAVPLDLNFPPILHPQIVLLYNLIHHPISISLLPPPLPLHHHHRHHLISTV